VPNWLVRLVGGTIRRYVRSCAQAIEIADMDLVQCEDQRPCARCITRGENCIHVNRGPKLVKLRCEWCRKENKKCEDIRPCRFCVEEGQECINAIRKGRGHGTRVMAVSVHSLVVAGPLLNEHCRHVQIAGLNFYFILLLINPTSSHNGPIQAR